VVDVSVEPKVPKAPSANKRKNYRKIIFVVLGAILFGLSIYGMNWVRCNLMVPGCPSKTFELEQVMWHFDNEANPDNLYY